MKTRIFKGMITCFFMCLLGFALNASDQWITISIRVIDGDTGDGIPSCELTSSSFQSQQSAIYTDFDGYTETFSLRKNGSVTFNADGYSSVTRTYSSSVTNDPVSMFSQE